MDTPKQITVETKIQAPIEKVWNYWTDTSHITNWNMASDDWHSPYAENDLRVGGKFLTRMEAKDGSFGFDFAGIYDEVVLHEVIAYTLGDGRKVKCTFSGNENETQITVVFDAETENPPEFQQQGWQAILDN